MSVEHIGLVLNHSQAKGSAKLVLVGIANHSNEQGTCWPSLRRLARYAGINQRNTRAAIRHLEQLGEIYVRVQAGGEARTPDYRRTNHYEITVECPAWCDNKGGQHRDTRVTEAPLWMGNHPRSPATSAPRSPATSAPRSPATSKPSYEPSYEPSLESSGSAIHSSHGELGRDELLPVGFTPPSSRRE